jgi:hypothetical protein
VAALTGRIKDPEYTNQMQENKARLSELFETNQPHPNR